jgi:acetylornithine/N-succinyldiaminopimelate aminotransferase|tara:strand:+ start:1936 stop:3108 length:1173 start_codon:yes stop_codon:yes gene_type:complete
MNYLMKNYKPIDISFEYGKGCYLYTNKKEKYLDALSGIGVCCIGHAHNEVTKIINKQSKKLIHVSNLFNIQNQENLANKLCKISKMNSAFFCNSGSEANEAAIKLARLHANNKNLKNSKIIIFDKSWHGRTIATLSATGNSSVQKGFKPLLGGFVKCKLNDIVTFKKLIEKNNVSAVMLETIQGEGGIRLANKKFLKDVRSITQKNDVLLIVDEVQTGMGRTGKWFSYQHANINPDIVTCAKGLGNGVPIGACLGNKKASNLFKPGSHGSTFGGNPLVCAVSSKVIDVIDKKNLCKQSEVMGDYLMSKIKNKIQDLSIFKEIRGKGLMIGIEINKKNTNIVEDCIKKNLILNLTSGNVIRLLPPLILKKNEADYISKVLYQILKEYSNEK